MKNYRYIIVAFFCVVGLFLACDNATTDFEGFDEKTGIKNIVRKEITMDDALYSTLVSALGDEDKEAKDFINTNKAFSPTVAPAPTYLPKLLAKEYFAADPTSAIEVSYKEIHNVDEAVAAYAGASYEISTADYQTVWGDEQMFVEAFTPNKDPKNEIPALLAAQFPDVEAGAKQNVNYYFSKEEPKDETVESYFLQEDFEKLEDYEPVNLEGWITVDLIGEYKWEGRSFNNNKFANVSSYKSEGKNDLWLITPAVELEEVEGIKLSFDINVRNFTQDILSVLISTDFSGDENKIKEATWVDVSNQFDLGVKDGNLNPAGEMLLDAYKGKTIYVAFQYDGDDGLELGKEDKKTTTYQVDNLKISKLVPGIAVAEKELQYAIFEHQGDNEWELDADNSLVVIQPEEYTAMGERYPNISKPEIAYHKIPIFLSEKYPYEMDEAVKTVIYYTWSDKATAEQYVLTSGVWERTTWEIEAQSQFILTEKDGWLFDPTLLVNFNNYTAGFQLVVDYVAAHQGVENKDLLDDRGNAEFYYGFNAYYPNITYRDKDRVNDPAYPINGTAEEKTKFMDQRTIEGLAVFLASAYPNAVPEVSGIEQIAKITGVRIYMDPSSNLTNAFYTYEFKCVGDKEWKALRRISEDDGAIDEYATDEE